MKLSTLLAGASLCAALFSFQGVRAQDPATGDAGQAGVAAPAPTQAQVPVQPATPAPPTAQAYVVCSPKVEKIGDQIMVPVSFLGTGMGASAGPIAGNQWRILYFGRQLDFSTDSVEAVADGVALTFPVPPTTINGQLYVPFAPIAKWMEVNWSLSRAVDATGKSSTLLLQYPAAYITDVRSSVTGDRVRVVVTLSNATRIVAGQQSRDVTFQFAGARQGTIPSVDAIGDYLVPKSTLTSGDWKAKLQVNLTYSAPVQWFTLGSPPRLVVDVQRLFEERSLKPLEGGVMVTKIRRGTGHGPVQMWAVKLDPRDGWRVQVAPGGWGVLQRARTTQLASRHKALLAVNGGFFAYDGAALGAVLVNNEWIRFPWGGRTAMGFTADGTAKIDNLQVQAYVEFGSGLKIPVRDLNGWPDKNQVTALTRRFVPWYTLKPGEMAVVVKDGKVISKPGGGGAAVSAHGFTLVASGSARQWLDKVTRGQTAKLVIKPIGWPKIVTALGGGPRLVKNGAIEVSALRENFRADVRTGASPRTAFGVDKEGRYIILVADGRQNYYSTGLTLNETAAVMQQLGAVDAMNLDGGGSTAMAIRGKLVNRPSDGHERNVANALVITR